MKELFNTVLYEPLFNFLIWLYDVIPGHDLGIAIIVLTILIKLLLFYPALKSLRSQKALQSLQPRIDVLKKEYAKDKEELGKQMMQLYKDTKVNPLSSCLPLLIQLPILLALFYVFQGGLRVDPDTGILVQEQLNHLYPALRDTYSSTAINETFLGIVNLGATHNIVLALLAGGLQFLQTRMLQAKKPAVKSEGAKDEALAANINKQMMYIFPIITVVFGYQFPAGVTLYWVSSTAFTWVQQLLFLRERKKLDAADVAEIVETTAKEKTK